LKHLLAPKSSMKLAIWIIRSPLDDSVEEGECVSVGVGMSSGLSQYMCEVSPATLGSESEVESNAVAGSVALLSKAFLVPVAAVRHSLARPDFEPARRSPSLWLLTTVRAEASAVGK
jgi:hypothetical protein